MSETYKLLFALYHSIENHESVVTDVTNILDPNLTVCPKCRIGDFQHVEGCKLALEVINDKRLQGFIIS